MLFDRPVTLSWVSKEALALSADHGNLMKGR